MVTKNVELPDMKVPEEKNLCETCGEPKGQRYFSIRGIGEIFSLSDAAVRGIIARKEVPHYKLGTRVRLRVEDFEALMVGQK